MADKFDLVVIGAGPGGYEAAIEGVQKGMKVALVENRELGGTCLNRGCIPTKTIIHTAELYHELQSGPSIGLTVREPAVDMEMVQKRKDEVLEQLRKGIASLMKTNKISVYYGTGTILDREPGMGGHAGTEPVAMRIWLVSRTTWSCFCPPGCSSDFTSGLPSGLPSGFPSDVSSAAATFTCSLSSMVPVP